MDAEKEFSVSFGVILRVLRANGLVPRLPPIFKVAHLFFKPIQSDSK